MRNSLRAVAKICILAVALLVWGCSDQGHASSRQEQETAPSMPPSTFHFLDQDHHKIKIEIAKDSLQIPSKKARPRPVLIMVLGLNSQSAPYATLFEHLKHAFRKKVEFLVILDKSYPQEQIDNFIKIHALHFPMLNPVDKAHPSTSLKTTTWSLPYFLLYNAQGALYRSYRGVIVEEMLAKEIQDLLQSPQGH